MQKHSVASCRCTRRVSARATDRSTMTREALERAHVRLGTQNATPGAPTLGIYSASGDTTHTGFSWSKQAHDLKHVHQLSHTYWTCCDTKSIVGYVGKFKRRNPRTNMHCCNSFPYSLHPRIYTNLSCSNLSQWPASHWPSNTPYHRHNEHCAIEWWIRCSI